MSAVARPKAQRARRRKCALPDPFPIIVYSDVICPWCYVGKRRLEAAIGGPGVPDHIRFAWRPYESIPICPLKVWSGEHIVPVFGEASAELDRKMAETGSEVGIRAFDRMQRTPNTRLAHRLAGRPITRSTKTPLLDDCSTRTSSRGLILVRPKFSSWQRKRLRRAGAIRLTGSESLDAVPFWNRRD